MRILQIHNHYSLPGGEDSIVDAEAALLEEAGHDVGRIRVANPATGAAAAMAFGFSPWNPLQARTVLARAREYRPDVAHVHNTWFKLSPAVFHALGDFGVPVVMTLQNYRLLCGNAMLFRDGHPCVECVGHNPWRAVVHRCYRDSNLASSMAAATIGLARLRRTFDLVDRFLVPSQFVKDLFVGTGFEADRITMKPNVVADPGRRASPPSASATVLYAGRLSPEKGVSVLLEGWRRSGLAGKGLELLVVGDGPQRGELEAARTPGVTFTGWMSAESLRCQMLESRVLVFPSQWYENFGRVIVEAMASGLAVLSSDVATPAEVVRALGPDWLVPPADVKAWSSRLGAVADGPTVDAAGTAARELFEGNYTLAHGLRALLDVYSSLPSRKGQACASY